MTAPTQSKTPMSVLRVLIHSELGGSWSLGELEEWRWVDEASGRWEGLVSDGTAPDPEWVTGDRLRRIRD